jgi:acyl carrier protein
MGNEKIEQILECVFTEESRQAAAGCPFVELECWDSLHYVHLVITVQATFGIELNQDQILRITTLDGLCEVLKEHGIAF